MMLKPKFLITYVFLSTCLCAQTTNSSVDTFLSNPNLKHASVGICVKDMSGKTIVAYNADKSFTPASTAKIITTATALELFGADFQYTTTLEKDKNQPNHLLVRGSGDPTLGTKHFDNNPEAFLEIWSNEILKEFGEKELEITIIDNLFGYDGVSSRWIHQDIGNYYAAGAYGISIFDNTYRIFFNTMRQDTCPVIVKTEPQMNHLLFTNTLKMNSSGQDNGYINGEPFAFKRILTGDIPVGRRLFSIKGDIPDPGLYLAERLSEVLTNKEIKVQNYSTTYFDYQDDMFGKTKQVYDGSVFYIHKSYPLSEIIKNINFKSNNHYAEHLIRTIGRQRNHDIYSSALNEGIQKINDYWKLKGLDTDALFLYDGCGLAPSDAVSPTFMCDILAYMQTKSSNSEAFLLSLPQAGKEGTVRNLLRGTRLEGKVYAKSGSIANVRCYAGYYLNGNKKYSFAVMVNNYNGNSYMLIKAIEKLMLGILS